MSLNFDAVHNAPAVAASGETRAYVVLAVNYSLFALSAALVSARVLVKVKLRKLGREDFLILISMAIILVLMVLTTTACKYGFGIHTMEFRPEWELTYSKISYTLIVLGSMCYPFTKVSMLYFYIRLSPHRTSAKLCYICILYVVTSSIAVTLVNMFRCTPVAGNWDRTINAKCFDASLLYYIYGSINAGTDILLMVLPIPILMRLQMETRVKFGLVVMFSIGILITGLNAYGVYAMYAAFNGTDIIWDGAYSWMWALVEFNAGVIVACMPSMLMFLKWIRGEPSAPKPPAPGEIRTIGSGERKVVLDKDAVDLFTVSTDADGEECVAMSVETLVETGSVKYGVGQ